MGLIAPNKAVTTAKKVNKKFLDQALAAVGNSEVQDEDGHIITYAQGLAKRVWHTALFSESDKESTSAAKFIMERINGKPAVLVEEEKEEIPEITFRVHTKDVKKLEEIANRDDVEEEPDNRLIVDIEGEPNTLEF